MINRLGERGHEIHVISRGKKNLPLMESFSYGEIHRVYFKLSEFLDVRFRWLSYPIFFNPFWIYKTYKVLTHYSVDLIVVRDLPLALMVGVLGKFLKKPVVLDMAENYPAALIAYGNPRYKPFLFLNGWLPRTYEHFALKFMKHILVVAEEQKTRLIKMGFSEDRISCILNTPNLNLFLDKKEKIQGDNFNGDELNPCILYVGKIDKHRGVKILIQAMLKVLKEFPNAILRVVGDGTEKRNLINCAEKMGIKDSVHFEGWVNFSLIPNIIKKSSVCTIPHSRSEHTDTTIPNKIFDYMAMGKPVVVSDCLPLQRIVQEEKCGVIFKNGDSNDLGEKIIQLLRDESRVGYGINGKKAVEMKYNWKVDSEKLIKTLDRFFSKKL
ncbi:MAG TPA: glycosyltransferase family 4 protein [Nitrospiria bacterium]